VDAPVAPGRVLPRETQNRATDLQRCSWSAGLVRIDVEILVLRHQLIVLQRQHPHPRFTTDDRAILTALSRVVRRDRWAIFMVKPDTIVGWHRRLVAKHWTCEKPRVSTTSSEPSTRSGNGTRR
jgi:hypothetical protein